MRKTIFSFLSTARAQRGTFGLRFNDSGDSDGGEGQAEHQEHGGSGGTEQEPTADKPEKSEQFDPDRAQRLVQNLRGDVSSEKSKRQAAEKAAEDAKSVLASIAKALNPDAKDGDPVDPKQLAVDLTRSQEETRQARVELAVVKAAAKHGADATALTDSRAFMARVGRLDPNADGFAAKVAEAIKKAADENPRLLAASGPQKSSPPISNGTGRGGGARPKSLHDAYAAHYARGGS